MTHSPGWREHILIEAEGVLDIEILPRRLALELVISPVRSVETRKRGEREGDTGCFIHAYCDPTQGVGMSSGMILRLWLVRPAAISRRIITRRGHRVFVLLSSWAPTLSSTQ